MAYPVFLVSDFETIDGHMNDDLLFVFTRRFDSRFQLLKGVLAHPVTTSLAHFKHPDQFPLEGLALAHKLVVSGATASTASTLLTRTPCSGVVAKYLSVSSAFFSYTLIRIETQHRYMGEKMHTNEKMTRKVYLTTCHCQREKPENNLKS